MPDQPVTCQTIDRILELAPAKLLSVDGFTYIDKDKRTALFSPPMPDSIQVSTLTGLIALLEADLEKFDPSKVLVRVVGHDEVQVEALHSDKWGRRQLLVGVNLMQPEMKFLFNQFHPQENFNIQLLSLFVRSVERDELLAISGNLAQQDEVRQQDDGITQRVTTKSGVHLVGETTPKPLVRLAPYRTFREVEQPVGDFIFRVRGGTNGNLCALFDADGGFWRITAAASVHSWISNQLKGSAKTGLPDIPVIA